MRHDVEPVRAAMHTFLSTRAMLCHNQEVLSLRFAQDCAKFTRGLPVTAVHLSGACHAFLSLICC